MSPSSAGLRLATLESSAGRDCSRDMRSLLILRGEAKSGLVEPDIVDEPGRSNSRGDGERRTAVEIRDGNVIHLHARQHGPGGLGRVRARVMRGEARLERARNGQ